MNLSLLPKNGDIVETTQVEKGVSKSINVEFAEDVGVIVSKGSNSNISKTIELPDSISAPISEGTIIGNAKFTLNNEVISSVPLVSSSFVNKINILTMTAKIINNWFYFCKK